MTAQNDSETKGPERIHILYDRVVHKTKLTEKGLGVAVEYFRADLYTQSQRELKRTEQVADALSACVDDLLNKLEQARGSLGELEQVKRKRDELTRWAQTPPDNMQKFQDLWGACCRLVEKAAFKFLFRYMEELEQKCDRYREQLTALATELTRESTKEDCYTCYREQAAYIANRIKGILNPPTTPSDTGSGT